MIFKKRPKSVKVNKYKLKTKKAAQKRYSIVTTNQSFILLYRLVLYAIEASCIMLKGIVT